MFSGHPDSGVPAMQSRVLAWRTGEVSSADERSKTTGKAIVNPSGPKFALLKRLVLAACLVLLASHPAAALDPVSPQLKWKHQFQFAGYYAALEQGFYRDAGLDVTIREGGPDIDAAEAVAGGQADFGVCSSGVLREWVIGRHLVVLAVIFQQTPAI